MNFDMGTYGVYIWPAYGATALGLAGAVLWCWLGWRAAKAKLAALERGPAPRPNREPKT
jgi:heme exporter protein CcmD